MKSIDKYLRYTLLLFYLPLTAVLLTACGDDDDDDDDDRPPEVLIIGTWANDEREVTATVNGEDLVDYLVGTGLSQSEAEAAAEEILSGINAFEGTITFSTDDSFVTSDGIMGSYTVSGNSLNLQFDDAFLFPINATIVEINSSTLEISWVQVFFAVEPGQETEVVVTTNQSFEKE